MLEKNQYPLAADLLEGGWEKVADVHKYEAEKQRELFWKQGYPALLSVEEHPVLALQFSEYSISEAEEPESAWTAELELALQSMS